MVWWIYKCNSRPRSGQNDRGDWNTVFSRRGVQRWGSTYYVPALRNLAPDDMVIAFQTNRQQLVGVAQVVRLQRSSGDLELYLRPLRTIDKKLTPLKEDPSIAGIPAFKQGNFRTIYRIEDDDAAALLQAAGASRAFCTKTAKQQRLLTETRFIEGEKRAAITSVRNPRLRAAAKFKWGTRCHCCGFDFEQFYGSFAMGCAIVHHLKTFAGKKRQSTVDDVRVVCANCHYIIHLTAPPLDVDKLRQIVQKRSRYGINSRTPSMPKRGRKHA